MASRKRVDADSGRNQQRKRLVTPTSAKGREIVENETKMFPILRTYGRNAEGIKPHPVRIPWSVAELAYSGYSAQHGTSQTLERLAERGGFGASEMDEYVPDWRERCNEITMLQSQLQ